MKIVWAPMALRDLQQIRTYIAADNVDAALQVETTIVAAVEGLRDFPAMGRPGKRPDTRELVVGGTLEIVVYTVAADALRIITVLHRARDRP